MKNIRKVFIRALQYLALYIPGARSMRLHIHRLRGVKIGKGVFIGADCLLDNGNPSGISIGDYTALSTRITIISHYFYKSVRPGDVKIGKHCYIGPNSLILPGLTIGDGAVVSPGSVVTKNVAPYTMVQGNPAKPIAKLGKSMHEADDFYDFLANTEMLEKKTR